MTVPVVPQPNAVRCETCHRCAGCHSHIDGLVYCPTPDTACILGYAHCRPKPAAAPDLDAIRERLAKISPWPWKPPYYDENPGDQGWWILNGAVGMDEYAVAVTFSLNPKQEADAEFISHAPADITALLQQLDAARAVIAAVEAVEPHSYDGLYYFEVDDIRAALSGATGAGE